MPYRLGQGADCPQQHPGNPPEGAALVAELLGLLQMLRIDPAPLTHLNTIKPASYGRFAP
jgi:hypothetical protein